jgi:hypothetical protein
LESSSHHVRCIESSALLLYVFHFKQIKRTRLQRLACLSIYIYIAYSFWNSWQPSKFLLFNKTVDAPTCVRGRRTSVRKRGRRRRRISNERKEKTGYWKLKEESLDRILWKTYFGRGYGPVVRQTTEQTNEWMMTEWMNEWVCLFPYLQDRLILQGDRTKTVNDLKENGLTGYLCKRLLRTEYGFVVQGNVHLRYLHPASNYGLDNKPSYLTVLHPQPLKCYPKPSSNREDWHTSKVWHFHSEVAFRNLPRFTARPDRGLSWLSSILTTGIQAHCK